MRYLILIITVLCFGDDKPKNAPPNTVQLTDKLYIDQTPISNQDWQEYLFNVANGRIETNKEIPYLNRKNKCYFVDNDSIAKKVEKLFKNNQYIEFILKDLTLYSDFAGKKFKNKKTVSLIFSENDNNVFDYSPLDYPVLSVNLNEAEDYCRWRTNTVMYFNASMSKRKRQKEYTKIQFRVPTHEEIDLAKSKYKSISDQAFYISKPDVDLTFLNHTFLELTSNNSVDSIGKKVGFRCVCDILEY